MISIKKKIIGGVAGSALLAATSAYSATIGTFDNTTVKVGGYLKLDAISNSFSDGTLPTGSYGRDFYVPSLTPVGGKEENRTFDMHARQSRFHIGTDSIVGEHKLKTYIEMDFMVASNPNGDERVSNSYTPRMRQAYLEYDNWLFGQTWSTFQNVGALPETADFIGNTDFSIFIRQPQIRYTAGNFQFSIENPESTITPNGGGARIVTDDNELPDFVGRYNFKSGDLSLVAAVLARQLAYNDGAGLDDTISSYGLSVSGKWMLGKDDIRFGVNTGSGMGRYIGLNVANGAVQKADGTLEAIDSTAYYAAYRHFWNAKWRSNITWSAIDIDNDTALTGTAVTQSTYSARINLFYAATDKLIFGGEYAHANRELESGADGNMDRFQFTAKLDF
ncbi:MAG: porin [Gammaproteobacteria bacterium]|nr:porin [Gammaproteobacteria bacterium]